MNEMKSFQGDFIFSEEPRPKPSFVTKQWVRVVVVSHVLLGIFTIVPSMVKASGDGTLDSTFGTGGKVTTSVTMGDVGKAVVVQSNGKIVVAGDGSGDIELVRYNADGSLDTSFDSDGKVVTDVGFNDSGNAIAIQNDGKIVVAGTTGTPTKNFAVVRYTSSGALDIGFGTGGIVITDIGRDDDGKSVLIQSDGKIVIAGTSDSDFAVVRFTSAGALDNTFDTDGKVTTDIGSSSSDSANSVAIQSDGSIVVAGTSSSNFAVVRYTSAGALDNTFDTDGKVTTDIGSSSSDSANSVAIQSDGAIVVAGESVNDFAIVRYASAGALDTGFGTGGKVTTDIGTSTFDSAQSVVIQSDSKIVVAGRSSTMGPPSFAVTRYVVTPSSPPTSTTSTSTTVVSTSTTVASTSTTVASTSTTIAPVVTNAPETSTTSTTSPTSTTSTTTVATATTTTVAVTIGSLAPSLYEKRIYSAKYLAKTSQVKISSTKAVVSISISKNSTKICTRAGNRIKTIKPGMCVITFIVQEPAKNGVRPNASRTTQTFAVK